MLENICTDLETSKKLKELGFEAKTQFNFYKKVYDDVFKLVTFDPNKVYGNGHYVIFTFNGLIPLREFPQRVIMLYLLLTSHELNELIK